MTEHREGFLYINSEILKQEVALSKKTGWLYTQDKYPDGSLVSYSPQEINILSNTGEEIELTTHNIKKYFGGTVIGFGNIDAKTGLSNNFDKAGSVGSVETNGKDIRQGELEIY